MFLLIEKLKEIDRMRHFYGIKHIPHSFLFYIIYCNQLNYLNLYYLILILGRNTFCIIISNAKYVYRYSVLLVLV